MVKAVVLSSITAVLCTTYMVFSLHVAGAQVMESTNYQIQSDSVNVGGNDTGTSTNYQLRTTIGEVGTGPSDSASYSIGAGYRQMQEIYIALSGATDVTMDPAIPGVTGGTANGSTTVTVVTDSPSGYALTITAENDPAMQKGANTIADYSPGTDPSFAFDVSENEAFFGFSPEGADIVDRYKDNGADCNTGGSFDTELACWDGASTIGQTIAQSTDPNHPNGATTSIRFRVGIGGSVNQDPGFYVATTTVTALPL